MMLHLVLAAAAAAVPRGVDVAVAAAAVVDVAAAARSQRGDVALNRVPFLFAHDAGTGYLEKHGTGVVDGWTKTQSTGFGAQLDCGARAFDARPKLSDGGTLVFHHGKVEVDKAFGAARRGRIREDSGWPADDPARRGVGVPSQATPSTRLSRG